MSETPITLAGTTVGTWIRDCPSLKSRTVQREHKLHFKLTLAVESPVAGIIESLPFIGTLLGPKVKKLTGSLKGSISIDVEAEPTRRTCVDKKQYVGYDLVILVKGTTSVTIAGSSVDVEVTVPVSVQGEEESCDCNPHVDPFAVSMSKLENRTLVAIPVSLEEGYAVTSAPPLDRLEPVTYARSEGSAAAPPLGSPGAPGCCG